MSRDWLTAEEAKAYNARAVRNYTLEECAKAIEAWEHAPEPLSYRDLIDRIRGLKDKP